MNNTPSPIRPETKTLRVNIIQKAPREAERRRKRHGYTKRLGRVSQEFRITIPAKWAIANEITTGRREIAASWSDGYLLLVTPEVRDSWHSQFEKHDTIGINEYQRRFEGLAHELDIVPVVLKVFELGLMKRFVSGYAGIDISFPSENYGKIIENRLDEVAKDINSYLSGSFVTVRRKKGSMVIELLFDQKREEEEYEFNFPKITELLEHFHQQCLDGILNAIRENDSASNLQKDIVAGERALDILWFLGIREICKAGMRGFFCGTGPTVVHATFMGVSYKVIERNTDHMVSLLDALRELGDLGNLRETSLFLEKELSALKKDYGTIFRTMKTAIQVRDLSDDDIYGARNNSHQIRKT